MSYDINAADTLYDITERYPETIDTLVEAGFSRMSDPGARKRFGSSITLETAAQVKGIEPGVLAARLSEVVEAQRRTEDATLAATAGEAPQPAAASQAKRGVWTVGLVPCPIRVPIMEELSEVAEQFTAETGRELSYDLQAAYTGTEWIEEHITPGAGIDSLPDVFLSAGYKLFFTNPTILSLKESGAFADRRGLSRMNAFGEHIGLEDPDGHYSIIGMVPAIFLVNENEIGDRPMPRSWEDLLHPRFENSVSLPIGDFDLFDGVLLSIYRRYGEAGVRALGRSLFRSLHPSQMIKGARGARSGNDAVAQPAVTVMPYFFSRTIPAGGPLRPVWPADGAIGSPILLLSRADRPEIQPVVDLFAGSKMAEILTYQGLFPATHPDIKNPVPESAAVEWPGWEYLNRNDLESVLSRCAELFDGAHEGAADHGAAV
ncbi:MAG: ABC transporter substrate-binding protein [Spirochaetota bacterium]